MFIDFRETEREREEKGERDINVKEKHGLVAFCMYLDQGSNLKPRYVP